MVAEKTSWYERLIYWRFQLSRGPFEEVTVYRGVKSVSQS